MGFTIFCTLCGLMFDDVKKMHSFQPPFEQLNKKGTSWGYSKNLECFEKFKKNISRVNTKWMLDSVVLDAKGKNVGKCTIGDSYNDIILVPKKHRAFVVINIDEVKEIFMKNYDNFEPGIVCHGGCYKKIKKISKKGENLFETYKEFIPLRYSDESNHMIKAFGKKRISHWGHDPQFYENGCFILNESDVDKSSNFAVNVYKRIHKIIDNRKSPVFSATEYMVGFKKTGIDGKIYKVVESGKTKKWRLN